MKNRSDISNPMSCFRKLLPLPTLLSPRQNNDPHGNERESTHQPEETSSCKKHVQYTKFCPNFRTTQGIKLVLISRTLRWMGLRSPRGTWVRYKVVWCCSRPSGEVIPARHHRTRLLPGPTLVEEQHVTLLRVSPPHGSCVSPHSDTAPLAQAPQR